MAAPLILKPIKLNCFFRLFAQEFTFASLDMESAAGRIFCGVNLSQLKAKVKDLPLNTRAPRSI